MSRSRHLTLAELERGMDVIERSPREAGELKLIVRRPRTGVREPLDSGRLDVEDGLVGDNWRRRGCSKRPDGSADPARQITVMNARVIALVAQDEDRWALAGDQLFVDLDLGVDNLPPGTRLALGSAVIEVTDSPHTGCKKFAERFGLDALKFLSTAAARRLRLRGLYARVASSGVVRVGDVTRRLS